MFDPSRLYAIACLWIWLSLWAVPARALDLHGSAPEGCPDEAAMQARLDALLGDKAAAVRVTFAIEPQRGGYRLKLRIDGEQVRGARELHGSDCAALADAGAWLIATAIDPTLSSPPPPPVTPEPEPQPEPAPQVEPTPEPAPPPAIVPRAPEVVTSAWVLHGAVSGGLLKTMERPPAQGAVGLSLGASWRWISTELRADVGIPSESALGRGTARVATQALALAGCGLWGDRFRMGPCLALGAVRTHAAARDLPLEAPAATKLWAHAQLGLQLAARVVRSLEVFLEGGVGTPLSRRPRFTVIGSDVSLDAEQVTAYGRLGLRFQWPLSPGVGR